MMSNKIKHLSYVHGGTNKKENKSNNFVIEKKPKIKEKVKKEHKV